MKVNGYLCPKCKQYEPCHVKRKGNGWLEFRYTCGYIEKERTKSIGKLIVRG